MTQSTPAEQPTRILAGKIEKLLAAKNGSALRRLLAKQNFADVAEVMENELSEEYALTCFQYLDIGHAAQVLTSLSEERQAACLSSLPALMGSKILRLMATDDAVDILQELDTDQTRKLLEEMPFDTETRTLQHLLLEEPDTAAGLMSPDYIEAPIGTTVGEALGLVRRAEEKDFIYYCYLIDESERLVGVVSLKQLILHDPSVPLKRIATMDPKSVTMSTDQAEVANLFRKYYNLLAMPVVDSDNVLRGIVTVDDVIYVIDEETSEDIYRTSGITLEEIDEKNLLTGSSLLAVKARIPWLSITMVGQLCGSLIIASHREAMAVAVVAISFMPLLTGLSGNMGTQSDTITVRGLSLNLINDNNIREKWLRELRVAGLTGGIFSVVVGTVSYLIYHHWELSLLLAGWILISLCTSASLGMMIPYWFHRITKQDPAGVGGPFITTMSDIMTFSVYLWILTLLLDRMI